MPYPSRLFGSVAALLLAGCVPFYSPMTFHAEAHHIRATGTIDARSQSAFDAVAAAHPEAKLIQLHWIAGSVDDEANLAFARNLRDRGYRTEVPKGGMIASGGTDLFLAGTHRTLAPGACVGVHSWGGFGPPAASLPRDHPAHVPYLAYYRAMGIDPDFYWFTLEAAPADGMHWMTAEEADRFGLTSGPAPRLGSAAECEAL